VPKPCARPDAYQGRVCALVGYYYDEFLCRMALAVILAIFWSLNAPIHTTQQLARMSGLLSGRGRGRGRGAEQNFQDDISGSGAAEQEDSGDIEVRWCCALTLCSDAAF
jgi:hypothetical protein